MNSIKRVLGNFVKSSDMLSHGVSLRHDGGSDYESYCTGVVSIVAFLLFFIIFIFKLLSIIQLQSISAFEHLSDNLESSRPVKDVMFAVMINGLSMDTVSQYFDITVTEVTISKAGGGKSTNERTIPLLPCQMSYWQGMDIDNMETLFSKRGMSSYYCPIESFTIQGTSDEDTYIYSAIKISPCRPVNPFCQNNATLRQKFYDDYVDKNQYFVVKLMMKDTIISPTEENPVSNIIQKDVLVTFSNATGTLGYIQIADYEIDTDTNILPWSQNQVTEGYYIYRYQTTTVPSTFRFLYLKLDKSTRKFSVEREYGKIDDMLSWVGGLFGLLFYCVQFVMGSYNEYRYELSVGQALFNYDDEGNQSKADDMGFWTYVKYSIYDWLRFFGFQLSNWTSMKQIDQTREEANEQMDVRHLMKKIRFLENVVQVLITEEQKTCLLLSELPTLGKIQKVRKLVEHYESKKEREKKELSNVDDEKKLGSHTELNSNPFFDLHNFSNFNINQQVNDTLIISGHPDNQIKETHENEPIDKSQESQFAREVAMAVVKIMMNMNDPINKKILEKMKPKSKSKVEMSKSIDVGDNDPEYPEQIVIKKQEIVMKIEQ